MIQHRATRSIFLLRGPPSCSGHIGTMAPVLVDLLIDDKLAATFRAAEFRNDLLAVGMGNGNHAFTIDLAEHELNDASVIRVRFNRRTAELSNSGKSVLELKALHDAR